VRLGDTDVGSSGALQRFEELWSFVMNDLSHSLGIPSLEDLRHGSNALLICLSGRQVTGVLWAERLSENSMLSDVPASSDSSSDSVIGKAIGRKAILGVRLIWVHRTHRKRNLATSLVDAARVYAGGLGGKALPAEEVAFSQPTTQGLAFATSYMKAACGSNAVVYAPE
jgi:hypothetical protein